MNKKEVQEFEQGVRDGFKRELDTETLVRTMRNARKIKESMDETREENPALSD